MIFRKAEKVIKNWIEQENKALLVTGARQIGKTFLIRECLKEFQVPYVEFNFIEQPELITLFETASNTQELLLRMSVASGKTFEIGKTIFFFDEVQECPSIISSLKS